MEVFTHLPEMSYLFPQDISGFLILEDYDGDGNMPLNINGNKISITFPDFIRTGLIEKAQNDSLVIDWDSGDFSTYVRWK